MLSILVLLLACVSAFAAAPRERSFDFDWRFLRAEAPGAEPFFQGRCLAILRPLGGPGTITLRAEADGLDASEITVRTR